MTTIDLQVAPRIGPAYPRGSRFIAWLFLAAGRVLDLLSSRPAPAQRVDDAPLAFDHLLSGSADQHQQWLDQQVEPGDPIERRKRFLGHLLARFGEQLGDHNLVERTDAAKVQTVGKIAVLWRPRPVDEE